MAYQQTEADQAVIDDMSWRARRLFRAMIVRTILRDSPHLAPHLSLLHPTHPVDERILDAMALSRQLIRQGNPATFEDEPGAAFFIAGQRHGVNPRTLYDHYEKFAFEKTGFSQMTEKEVERYYQALPGDGELDGHASKDTGTDRPSTRGARFDRAKALYERRASLRC